MIRLEVIVTHEPSREPASAGPAAMCCPPEPIRLDAAKLGDGKLLEGIGKLFLIIWPIVAPYLPKPSATPPAA